MNISIHRGPGRTAYFLIWTLVSIQGPAFQEPGPDIQNLSRDELFYRARQVLVQKTPSPVGYFRLGDHVVAFHQGNKKLLEGSFEQVNLFIQSGDHLITGQRMAPWEIWVHAPDGRKTRHEVSGISFASTVDLIDGRL